MLFRVLEIQVVEEAMKPLDELLDLTLKTKAMIVEYGVLEECSNQTE